MSKLTKLLEGVKVEWKSLQDLVTVISAPSKVKKEVYRKNGKVPIIDQGIAYIAGYTDDLYATVKADKYIIFGDHSEHIKYIDFSFVQGADGLKILKAKKDYAKYLYYSFINFYKKELSYKRHWTNAKETLIPIPCPDNPEKSLKIQEEIVRILDRLSEETNQLNAALQKELNLHQKRYDFYREELFKFQGKEVEWKSLGEIAEIGTGSRNTNEAVIDGEYPFFVRSQIPRKINEFEFDETAIITAGDGVGVGKVFHFVNGKYALHQRAYRIVVKCNKVNPKFLFYYIKSNFSKYVEKNSVFASVTSLRKPMFDKYPVPVASFEVQERIIKLVDDLDFTTNSIIAEIQKEIELRNKQYEYYRDRLLSF